MADIKLDPINRSRLDGIVQKALTNGEDENTIRQIVSEYKTKYGRDSSGGYQKDAQGNPIFVNDRSVPTKNRQSMGGSGPDRPTSETFRDSVGNLIPSMIATGASAVTENPAVGGAVGSGVGELLRRMAPNYFGGPDSGSIGGDLAMNVALPGVLGQLSKFASGPRQFIADKLASSFGQKTPPVKNLMQAESQLGPGFENTARDARMRGFNAPEPNLDEVKQIIQKASENTKDAVKNPVVRYARNSLVFRLGAMAGLGGLSPTAAAVGSTLVVGDAVIKQLTKDPEIAQLLIKAIKTPGDSEQAGLISKTLLNAMRGSAVTIKLGDGEEQPAMVDNEGKLVYKR